MGLLTLYCYEEGASSSGRSHASRRSAATALNSQTDQSAGLYLLLVGRATATLGSDQLTMSHYDDDGGHGPRPLRRGDRVVIEGVGYRVKSADTVGAAGGQSTLVGQSVASRGASRLQPPLPQPPA